MKGPDHRTSEYKDLVGLTPSTQELLSETIDGETFIYQASPQCKICNGNPDLRNLVDTLLLFPKSYVETLRSIQPLQDSLGLEGRDRVNYENIRVHQKNHLPFDKMAVRDIVERRANERGKKIISTEGHLLTPEAFYEVVVTKGFEDIVSGAVRPTLSQTMQAMEMLDKLETKVDDSFKPEVLLNQLNIIVTVIREVLPPEYRELVLNKIEEYSDQAKALPTAREIAEEQDYIDEDLLYED